MISLFYYRLAAAGSLLLAGALATQAQVSKFNIHGGFGSVVLRSTAPALSEEIGSTTYGTYVLQTTNTNVLLGDVGAGFDAPLLQFAKGEQALGVSLNAQLGILGSQQAEGFNEQVLYDFPEYVTYRYGAKASKHAKSKFGVGVGGGYRFSHFFLPFRAPSALLEGVYSTSRADYFLRLTADLQPTRFYDYYASEGLIEVLSIREVNVVLGYSF